MHTYTVLIELAFQTVIYQHVFEILFPYFDIKLTYVASVEIEAKLVLASFKVYLFIYVRVQRYKSTLLGVTCQTNTYLHFQMWFVSLFYCALFHAIAFDICIANNFTQLHFTPVDEYSLQQMPSEK